MALANAIKIQNHDRIFLVQKPPNFSFLQNLFETRFNLQKPNLSIYYLDSSDGNRTFVDDDEGLQLAYEDQPHPRFLTDDQPASFFRGKDNLTMEMLRTHYFKKHNQNLCTPNQTRTRAFACHNCKLAKLPSKGCIECNGVGGVDYSSALPGLTEVLCRDIDELILDQFRRMYRNFMSQNGKLDQSMYLDKTFISTNSNDVTRPSFNLSLNAEPRKAASPKPEAKKDVSQAGLVSPNFPILSVQPFSKLNQSIGSGQGGLPQPWQTTPSSISRPNGFDLRDCEDELLNTQMLKEITKKKDDDSSPTSNQSPLYFQTPTPQSAVHPLSISLPAKATQSAQAVQQPPGAFNFNLPPPMITNTLTLNAIAVGRQPNHPKKEELVYEGVKICKVFFKDGYITINVMIYNGENGIPWPEGVYIVGDSNSVITKEVMIRLPKSIPKKGFLAQAIKFKVNDDLIKTGGQYSMLFSFQMEDEEKAVSYWSKPFCVPFNAVSDTKKRSTLSCDFLSF